MTSTATDPLGGLSTGEVAARAAAGHDNRLAREPTRTVWQILRANVLTRFNAILGALFVVILVVGPPQDALFGAVLIANTAIGVAQEIRAKLTLDRLAVMSAPRASVVRDGVTREIPLEEIVLGDLLLVTTGDQLSVDGEVMAGDVEVDESLLTGEADPVHKTAGSDVLSGSFVVSGAGSYRATAVGADSYAERLTSEARRFTLVHSELQSGTNVILRGITWAIAPVTALLVASQLSRPESDLADAIRGTVAGVGSMVPEGLVLLTSLAFALAVVRLARREVLVQELGSVEGLARVDTICLDKTGTLTEGGMSFRALDVLSDGAPAPEALGALAAADPHPNASLRAVSDAFPAPTDWVQSASTPFSSARKWGAASFGQHGTWLLGAPEVMLSTAHERTLERAEEHASEGHRVLLLARTDDGVHHGPLEAVSPVALVVLSERTRPDAAKTIEYLVSQDVSVKVISGDHPATVAAIARGAGVPRASQGVDARSLPGEADRLAEEVESNAVFGRVTPHQKRAMVAALQSRGHVVAMTGDGVNDVLALKDADLGVAMGSGSAASRAVSQLIILRNSFDVLPAVLAEGRRVIANVERVANLFVTKTVYATLISLVIGALQEPFPFLPRHLTVISSLTIGAPAVVLALAPNAARYSPGFVRRTLMFTVPAGCVAGGVTLAAYGLARNAESLTLGQARSTATIALFVVGLWILFVLMRPYRAWKLALGLAMAAGFAVVLAVGPVGAFFALAAPPPAALWGSVSLALGGGLLLEAVLPLTRHVLDRSQVVCEASGSPR